jgi:HK97 family phage major capsid protein
MASNSHANDAMIRRLEKELQERSSAANAIIANAQDSERDLNDSEKQTLSGLRGRMEGIRDQLTELESTAEMVAQTQERMRQFDQALTGQRRAGQADPVEYRSAGSYLLDYLSAANGSQQARDRLDVYTRAAAHQKTSDNLGLIPDPIVGDLVNFIDAARPIVGFLGPRDMPSATWHRPKVTQHSLVGAQGSAGAAADEKAELSSQKMTITRLDGNAVTYGGYVNVSRQNMDFSSPNALDAIITDLATQYAIQTEAVVGAAIQAIANNVELAPVATGNAPSATELVSALWTAVGNIYAATKGQGRVALIVPPSRLGSWGSLFAPVNPTNAQSAGFQAGNFGQGIMGYVSGVPVIVSAGYPTTTNHYGSVISSAAVEVYEQRVGALQASEPSVLGVQVAYAGYFTPMTIESTGVQRIVNLT